MNELNLTTPSLLFSAISLILLAYTNRFLSYATVVRTLNERYQENPDKDPTTLKQIRNFVLRLRLIRWMQTFGAASLIFCLASMFLFSIHQNMLGEVVFGAGMTSLAISLVLCVWEIQISTEAISLHLQNIRRRQREQDPFVGSALRRNANRREGESLGEHNNRKNKEKQQREKQERDAAKTKEKEQTKPKDSESSNERLKRERPERKPKQEQAEEVDNSTDNDIATRTETSQGRGRRSEQGERKPKREYKYDSKQEQNNELSPQGQNQSREQRSERKAGEERTPRREQNQPKALPAPEVKAENNQEPTPVKQPLQREERNLPLPTANIAPKPTLNTETTKEQAVTISAKDTELKGEKPSQVNTNSTLQELAPEANAPRPMRKIFAKRQAKATASEELVEKRPSRYQQRRERKVETN